MTKEEIERAIKELRNQGLDDEELIITKAIIEEYINKYTNCHCNCYYGCRSSVYYKSGC